MIRGQMSNRTRLLILLVVTAGCLVAGQLSAQAYVVTLKNGNSLIAKYKPEEASYDSSKMVLMTAAGNQIALAKDDIESVEVDLENRGFGVPLDQTTVLVGFTANDKPDPNAEGAEGEGNARFPGLNQMSPFGSAFPSPGFPQGGFVSPGGALAPPTIGEPNTSGGGIPLGFVSGGVAPIVPATPPP